MVDPEKNSRSIQEKSHGRYKKIHRRSRKKSIVDSDHNSWSIQENMVDPEKKINGRSRKIFKVDPEQIS